MKAVVELQDVHVRFGDLRALDGVSLAVRRGATLGIVGESGCGKSTLARVLVGLQAASAGTVLIDGEAAAHNRPPALRRRIQMVFQDPASSLNPRMTVGVMLRELLGAQELRGPQALRRAHELVELVGLPGRVLESRPGALSGGQRQRVAIARALAVEPEVLVADEAVAALDVSVQATVVNLLRDLQRELDLTLLFITHDLGVVRSLCEEVIVMYLGRVVERATATALFAAPEHPYTRALLAAAPRLDTALNARHTAVTRGELPSPYDVPSGCRFHPRCPVALSRCATFDPPLRKVGEEHLAACVHAYPEDA